MMVFFEQNLNFEQNSKINQKMSEVNETIKNEETNKQDNKSASETTDSMNSELQFVKLQFQWEPNTLTAEERQQAEFKIIQEFANSVVSSDQAVVKRILQVSRTSIETDSSKMDASVPFFSDSWFKHKIWHVILLFPTIVAAIIMGLFGLKYATPSKWEHNPLELVKFAAFALMTVILFFMAMAHVAILFEPVEKDKREKQD